MIAALSARTSTDHDERERTMTEARPSQWPMPASANAQQRFLDIATQLLSREDVVAIVVQLLGQARTFQSPDQALRSWGDPSSIEGALSPALSPTILYRSGLTADGMPTKNYDDSVALVAVKLRYHPPAAAPRRLEDIEIHVRPSPSPPNRGRSAISEARIVSWLGPFARRGKPVGSRSVLIWGSSSNIYMVMRDPTVIVVYVFGHP